MTEVVVNVVLAALLVCVVVWLSWAEQRRQDRMSQDARDDELAGRQW